MTTMDIFKRVAREQGMSEEMIEFGLGKMRLHQATMIADMNQPIPPEKEAECYARYSMALAVATLKTKLDPEGTKHQVEELKARFNHGN